MIDCLAAALWTLVSSPGPARLVRVGDGAEPGAALAAARAGDLIVLRDGTYSGRFEASGSGRPEAPILVCGGRGAVLDGGSVSRGYGLHVTGSHWVFRGFTVSRAKKGIMLDGASHNVLEGLEVRDIGNEGIHFRAGSSDNVLSGSFIHDTGRDGSPHHGEGVYVGSAVNHWCEHSGCGPDRSDRNRIVQNTIGPGTTAESIDVKEGTTGGVIRGNVFSGLGMVDGEGADSWVDVKGNDWLIEGNRGEHSPRDGFQVYEKAPGWGRGNRFTGNVADVHGPGHGIRIASGSGNIVACDNETRGAKKGLSNVACEPLVEARGLSSRGRR
jgi:hypothetical protein